MLNLLLIFIVSVVESTTPQALISYQNVSDASGSRINVTCDATYDCRHKLCYIMISEDAYNVHYFPITRVPCENTTSNAMSYRKSKLRVIIACYENRHIVHTIQCNSEEDCYRQTCKILTNDSITALAYVTSEGTEADCQHV